MDWAGIKTGVFELKELAAGKIQPPPPLFGELVLDNTLTMISAPPFTGKSLLTASMIVSLDSGLPLFEKYAPAPQKKVLAFLQDAPTWDYAEQFRRVIRGYGLDEHIRDLLESRLIINRGVQVTDPDFMENLEKEHADRPFNVVFFDAFWTLHSFNERDPSQMGYVMRQFKLIREKFGAAVFFTHHDRKMSAEDAAVMNVNYVSRGSTVIPSACDFHLHLKRNKQRIIVEKGKARGADEDMIQYDIVEIDHPEGFALKLTATDPHDTRQGKLLLFIQEPKKRAEMVAFYKSIEEMTEARANKAVDNDLRILQAYRKVEKVSHGVWRAK